MRKAMICASIMLALVQLWPMLFGGGRTNPPAAITRSAPGKPLFASLVETAQPLLKLAARDAKPQECGVRLQRAIVACRTGDAACRSAAADHADLCEATGFWPG